MPGELVHARDFAPLLPWSGEELPTEIQWMPPGRHDITAEYQGKPRRLTVNVDAAVAARLADQFNAIVTLANAGQGDIPFLDFDHQDGAASGHPTAIRWAGDDPVNGGIRIAVDWTGAGKQALAGRDFRRFSPSFLVDAEGAITGLPVNMGGLVNRAAFKTITPVVAADAGDPTPSTKYTMTPEEMMAEIEALRSENAALKEKLAASDQKQVVAAKDAEITSLKAKIVDFEKAQAEQIKLDAKEAVAAAVQAGKVAPKDEATIAHLESLYVANKAATKAVLASMPVNPALAKVIPQGREQPSDGPESDAQKFVAEVHAKAAENGGNKSASLGAVIKAKPDLYQAWLKAGGQPGI